MPRPRGTCLDSLRKMNPFRYLFTGFIRINVFRSNIFPVIQRPKVVFFLKQYTQKNKTVVPKPWLIMVLETLNGSSIPTNTPIQYLPNNSTTSSYGEWLPNKTLNMLYAAVVRLQVLAI